MKGLGSVVSPSEATPAAAPQSSATDTEGVDAFAVRFARSYLADPAAESLAPYLAEGARIGSGIPPTEGAAGVAQAEVSHTEELGGGESVLTVACQLRDSRTLYLAVPVIRSNAGEVAAQGAPWMVAGPGDAVAAGNEQPGPIAGSEGSEIESLIGRFLPAYIASGEAEELSYLLLPGVTVQPLAGVVTLKSVASVSQLGDGDGPRRTIAAAVRVTDPTGGATYPLVYRLAIERSGQGDRWYVAAVEGVSA